MDFLYFPDDKTEYIPAVIMLIIFMIGAVISMYIINKKSKKEQKRFEEAYNIRQTGDKPSKPHK